MTKYLLAYAATVVVIVAIDLIWLGVIAKPIYARGIGHLMADRPNVIAAILFYLIFAVGLMMFAVVPNQIDLGWQKTLIAAAAFGFIAYATYDLTNLATLKNWPIGLSIIDMAWGTLVSTIAAAVGRLVLTKY
ncbi:MAG: DUF2177 family protein [Aeromicrobium sp.]|nr:DUF2177 family protein [Burkholderiales bacterium]